MSEENIVKIIEIISWPFFLALTITILSLIYKAPFGILIEKLERARVWWKKGDTEFEVQQKDDRGEKSKESIEEEKITSPPLLPEIAAIQESSEASASEIKTQDELIKNINSKSRIQKYYDNLD
ncbi:MAG: hypothetical protein HYR94_00265 [Chloroflexi bacterium]|nr:hypothetical protein [Chloroflexota bacterium]